MAEKPLRLASTVILLAPVARSAAKTADYKVLMMKRAKTMKFMPGVHVFPGGAIDEIDKDARWTGVLGADAPQTLLAERLGAVRETFEEAGVLLAKPEGVVNKIPKDELAHWRQQVVPYRFCVVNAENEQQVLKDGKNFLSLFEKYNIKPAVNDLVEWAVWITPPFEAKRFYTRFFLAKLPYMPTEETLHESNENVTTDWLRPDEAIAQYKAGVLKLIPPQFHTMVELSQCLDMAKVADMRKNYKVVPIQPEFQATEDGRTVAALPGDPLHPNGATDASHRHRIYFGNVGESIGSANMSLDYNLPADYFSLGPKL